MTSRPRRSALYMPASNARAIEKARGLDCDVIILDLEDAVAPEAKPAARAQAMEAVKAGGFGRRELVIRCNGLDTPWGAEDLAAAAEKKRLPLCKIIRGDFVQDPSLLVIDADVLFYSGSLNTMNEQSFYDCLRAGFAAAKLGIAFNFLSSKSLAASPHLTWHQSDKVRDFAQTLSSRVSFWDDYLPGDSTIAIWKEKP